MRSSTGRQVQLFFSRSPQSMRSISDLGPEFPFTFKHKDLEIARLDLLHFAHACISKSGWRNCFALRTMQKCCYAVSIKSLIVAVTRCKSIMSRCYEWKHFKFVPVEIYFNLPRDWLTKPQLREHCLICRSSSSKFLTFCRNVLRSFSLNSDSLAAECFRYEIQVRLKNHDSLTSIRHRESWLCLMCHW